MNKLILLLLAGLITFAATGFSQGNSFSAERNARYVQYRIFENTTSPNGQFALGWGTGRNAKLEEAIDRNEVDQDKVEDFLVFLPKDLAVATLEDTHFWPDPTSGNVTGGSISATWGSSSDLVVVNCEGKWGSHYLRAFKIGKIKVDGSLGIESAAEKVIFGWLAKNYAAQYKRSADYLGLSYDNFEAEGENSFGVTATTIVNKMAPENADINVRVRLRFFIEGEPDDLKFTLLTVEEAATK
ncbi:hypothetical protein BH09VER1_BH09VER1_48460 [soil metagenome]